VEENLSPTQKELIDSGNEPEEEGTTSDEGKSEPESPPQTPSKEEAKVEGTPYKGRFKTIKTVEQLEDSFRNSYTEANKLLEEKKKLEEELNRTRETPKEEDKPVKDPEIEEIKQGFQQIQEERDAEAHEQYKEFVNAEDRHRILDEDSDDFDPKIAEDFMTALNVIAARAKQSGKRLTVKSAMSAAWKYIEPDINQEDAERKGAEKAANKALAATESSGGAGQIEKKTPALTPEQKSVAARFGISEEDYAANL
jgi:hypothetical protein